MVVLSLTISFACTIIYRVEMRRMEPVQVPYAAPTVPQPKFKKDELVVLPNDSWGIVVSAYTKNSASLKGGEFIWHYDVEMGTSENDLVIVHELEEHLLKPTGETL